MKVPHRFALAARYHAALLRGGTLTSYPKECAALALRHADAFQSLALHYEGRPAPSAVVIASEDRAAPAAPGGPDGR